MNSSESSCIIKFHFFCVGNKCSQGYQPGFISTLTVKLILKTKLKSCTDIISTGFYQITITKV